MNGKRKKEKGSQGRVEERKDTRERKYRRLAKERVRKVTMERRG
jgi:hypothetical protein